MIPAIEGLGAREASHRVVGVVGRCEIESCFCKLQATQKLKIKTKNKRRRRGQEENKKKTRNTSFKKLLERDIHQHARSKKTKSGRKKGKAEKEKGCFFFLFFIFASSFLRLCLLAGCLLGLFEDGYCCGGWVYHGRRCREALGRPVLKGEQAVFLQLQIHEWAAAMGWKWSMMRV